MKWPWQKEEPDTRLNAALVALENLQSQARAADEKTDKIIDWLGVLLRAEIDRRKRETEKGGQPRRQLRQ